MQRDLDELIELQACDGEIARLSSEIAALPGKIAAIETALAAARATLATAEKGLKAEEVARRSQESDVKDHQLKIKKYRTHMDTVQNDAQLKALEHEIAFAEKAISSLEDAELESMERTEGLEVAKKKASEDVENQSGILARTKDDASVVKSSHEAMLVLLKKERERLRGLVSEKALADYDRVAKAKKTGLAAAWDQKCSACQMMVRPQRWNDLRNADIETPIPCETCGRRLYYDVGHGTDAAKERVALKALEKLA
ncbi:MAG TPA: C4-type zinc ribbon domain-containing protein [Acidobacteriaceae bacterium]|nr:C4-type zinc ribbon domain-containing protein [Acidobacteriaceae bacterium]